MQTIRIILSAAKSLQQERMELADLVENLNHSLESRNANILMLVWDSSESDQVSFKEKISETDLCLTLYYDTFDESTQSELETAYQSLCEGKNPKKIYVYFKEGETVPEQLKTFRDSFPTKYGHFYCSFSNIDTLKADFLLQFMEYQSKNFGSNKMLEVNNGKVTIDGKEYVDLKNVPFAGNNEEYNLLLKSIKKTQKLLAITDEDDPDYADYAADLQDMKEKLSKMESSLWETALMITRLSTTKCSERLKRAMDLFTAGDNRGAQAVLNEEEIDKDIEHNLNLIKLGEEGKKGLITNIEEIRLKIKTLDNDWEVDNCEQIISLYQKAISLGRDILDKDDYTDLLWDYAGFLDYQNLYTLADDVNKECLAFLRDFAQNGNENAKYDLALFLNNIAVIHRKEGVYDVAETELLESLTIRRALTKNNERYYKPGLARCLEDCAILKTETNNFNEALSYIEEALKYRKDSYTKEEFTNSDSKYAHCLGSYGHVLSEMGRINDAINALNKSTDIYEHILMEKPEDVDTLDALAMSSDNLANLYKEIYKYEIAKERSKRSLGIYEFLYNKQPNAYRPGYACNLLNIGCICHDMCAYEEALPYITKAYCLFKKMEEMNPGAYIADVALCLMNRANTLCALSDFSQSEEDYSEALSIYKKLAEQNDDIYLEYVAICIQGHCQLLDKRLDYNRSCEEHSEAVSIYRNLSQKYPDIYLPELAHALSLLGWQRINTNEGDIAEKELKEAISIYKNHDNREYYKPYLAEAYLYLGRIYYDCLEKYDNAIEALQNCILIYNDMNHNNGANFDNEIGMAYGDLGNAFHAKKDLASAIEMFKKSIESFEDIPNRTDTQNSSLANTFNNLAWLYYEKGNIKEAEPLAWKAVELEEILCAAIGSDTRNIANFRDTLNKILELKNTTL